MNLVLWPDGGDRTPGWDGGPDVVAYPAVPFPDVLETRPDGDAWVAAYEVPPGEETFPRLNASAANADPDGAGRLGSRIRVPIAFLDLDRAGHAPWDGGPDGLFASAAFRACLDLFPDAAAVYTTRAGLRVVYVLDAPPTLDDARDVLVAVLEAERARVGAALGGLGLVLDESAPTPWRGFRLPYATRDGVALDALLEVRPGARIPTPEPVRRGPGRRDGDVDDRPIPDPYPPCPALEGPDLPVRVREHAHALTSGAALVPAGGDDARDTSRHALHLHLVNALAWFFAARTADGIAESIFGALVRSVEASHAVSTSPDTVAWLWAECLRAEARERTRASELAAGMDAVRKMAGAALEAAPADEPPPVLAYGGSFLVYDRDAGTYVGPLHANSLFAALRDLHPDVPRRGPRGTHLPGAMIVDLVGDRCDRAFLVPEGSTFAAWDPRARIARIRCAPRAEVAPVCHPEVQAWLDALLEGSPSETLAGKLLAWVASVRRLEYPTAALYLQGPPGTGKSMLATAIAQFWGSPPVPFERATDTFNGALRDCPVVHLEEGGTGLTRRTSGLFRRLVTERYHDVNEKHIAACALETHLRVVITANNANALRTTEAHTAEDIAAIAQRVLHLHVSPAAERYLESIGGRTGTAEWVQTRTGAPGRVVEHIAWLEANLEVAPEGRFLVTGETTEYHRELVTRGVPTGSVLVAIALAVLGGRLSPDFVPDENAPREIVWVNAKNLHGRWRALVDEDGPRPTTHELSETLRSVAIGAVDRKRTPGTGDRARFWPVSVRYVVDAADAAGLAGSDTIPDVLERLASGAPSGSVVPFSRPGATG